MERAIFEVSKERNEHRLEMLTLALVSKRVSMSLLLADGFTPGQVMRALLTAQDAGYVSTSDKKSELSELGLKRLAEYKFPLPKEKWILPAESEKVSPVSVTDIVLPEVDDVLD